VWLEHLHDAQAQIFNMKIFQPGGGGGVTNNGSGSATRVAYWISATQIGGDANFFFDPTNDRLSIGKPSTVFGLDVLESINTDEFYRIEDDFVLGQTQASGLLAVGNDARNILTAPLSTAGTNNLAIATQSNPPNTTMSASLVVGQNIPASDAAGFIGDLSNSIFIGVSSVSVNGVDNTIIDQVIVLGTESFTNFAGDTHSGHIIIGNLSYTQPGIASGNLIIGHETAISPGTSSNNIIIGGANTFADTDFNIILGNANTNTITGHASSAVVGHFSNIQSANVIAIGGDVVSLVDFGMFTMYLGRGEQTRETSVEGGVIYTASKAFDTDIAGIDVHINGGQSTGTGIGGKVIIGTSKAGSTGSTLNGYANVVEFDENGNIRAARVHNNLTAQGGATEQDIRSGTYTPTLFNTTNVAASTARKAQWLRLGNVVTVSGQLDIDPTGIGAVLLGISLPVASDFATAFQLGGTASSMAIANESAGLEADATNNRASLKYVAVDTTNHTMAYTFTYVVI